MQALLLHALYLLPLSCLVLHFCCPSNAQDYKYFKCNNSMNYTSDSAYQQNLNHTLFSLATNAPLTGYNTSTTGMTSNASYGLMQCPGYVSMDDCQACAFTVVTEIIELCPNQKEASMGNENCSLQYSDRKFFSREDNVPRLCLVNLQNVDNPILFSSQWGNLLTNLSSNAAADPSRLAAGSNSYTTFISIYGMVQCSRDLSRNDCLSCLQNIISYGQQCSDKKVGARVFAFSCNIRYETYSFFTLSMLPASPPSPPSPTSTKVSTGHDGKNSTTIVIVVIACVALALTIASICSCFFLTKAKRKRDGGANEEVSDSLEPITIGLNTLREATKNFCDENKLGEGGFGPVYKGKLQDGQEIAVKRLSKRSVQGIEELKTEVMVVAKLMHRNLVRLLGFCLEEEEKLLVYEYLPNGSLDKVLFDQNRRFTLDWERRYKIIIGIARGLLYLHQDSLLRIIHRDLKASNILLDEFMNPKISDFGLARLFVESQIQGNTTRIAGTYGYMAPEYIKKGHFSVKSDVYSFGIMVLETVTGQKSSSFRDQTNLQSFAWEHWANGTALELLDPTLDDQCSKNEVLKCIHIGLLCVQEASINRPTMAEVIMMLSSYTVTAPSPLRPAFHLLRESFRVDEGSGVSGMRESVEQSTNDVSITELDPR